MQIIVTAMKKRITVILFFCILIGYILLFPGKLQKELVCLPSWAAVLNSGLASGNDAGPKIPFKLDDRLGYLSSSGDLSYLEEIIHEAVVTEDYFINYSSVSRNLVLQSSKGGILGNIATEGLPFVLNDRSFIISPDRMTISEHDLGSILWSVTPGSIITSMDVNSDLTLIGLMNGQILLFDPAGEEIFSFFSTESRYSIVYSCALSDDGRRIAVISGLYPQQLICFEFRNESYTAVFREAVDQPFRRNLFMDYSADGKLLYLEVPEGVSVISSSNMQKEFVELDGMIVQSELRGVSELSYLLFENADESILRVFRPDIGRIAEFHLPSGELYFNSVENCVYIGWNGIIVRYDLIEG